MTPFLQLAIALALFIAAAKLGGYLSIRIGQPAVLGELIVGILLGPSVINVLSLPYFTSLHLSESIQEMADLGVLLLMFLAGLDLHVGDLIRSMRISALAGTFGVILPLILGTLIGLLFSMEFLPALFIGLIISATSVSISAQTLMELKVLRSRLGVSLLGAAVFDDILVLLGLSIFTAQTQTGSSSGWIQILWIVVQMALFIGIASAIGLWLFPRFNQRVSRLPVSQGLVSFALVILLIYSWSAEVVGQMAAITGAFLAGLWFGRTPQKERIHTGIATIAYGIFVPIFFINIGLSANARELNGESALLMLAMLIVAVISKIFGSGLGAKVGGLTSREALQLGVGMMSRGEVGLIVASIGVEQGAIPESAFSAMVGVVIFTTLLTPPLLRILFPKGHAPQAIASSVSEGEIE